MKNRKKVKIGAPRGVSSFALQYGDYGFGDRAELLLGSHSLHDDQIRIGWDCASASELDCLIDNLIQELESIRKYGRQKFKVMLSK